MTSVERQIPIVCPGHTRPLAELQFCSIKQPPQKKTQQPNTKQLLSSRTFLISACHDKNPMLRDSTTGDWIGTLMGHKGAVWSAKLDPSANLAATASGDFSVKVWDAITGSELFVFAHKHIVKTVDFSPDSRRLATGGHEGILRIYDLVNRQTKKPIEIMQGGVDSSKQIIITKCVWLNNNIVLAADSDGNISIWNVSNSTLLHTLHVDAAVRDMEYLQSKQILTVAAGQTVTFFQLAPHFYSSSQSSNRMKVEGKFLRSHVMPIHFREEGGASLHPNGTKFVAGGSDLWVRVFDFDTGKELECHRGHHGPIRCLRYAPDGMIYATGSEDGTIRLWKTDP